MVTKERLKKVKALAMEENAFPPYDKTSRFALRAIMYDVIGKELIPVELFETVCKFSLSCYNPEGKGYNGIKTEIIERIKFSKDVGLNSLPLSDFFKHTAKEEDIYDFDNDKGIEVKTGCGNWIYSNYRDLSKARKELEDTNNNLLWKYHYTRKTENEFSFTIHIATDWKTFFAYLDTYPKGFETFFKFNRVQSEKCGCCVFEMNTLKTSKKKVRFLRQFNTIK
jgi:hypothetical protein